MAKATLPNVCKMPGPPAPFVPAPLPNIAKSELSPKGYSTTVKIEGNTVAIRGATFESMGDMASKGTGGGLISANAHGPAKFITPGSLTVKIEGKSVHLLSEPMLNNCGPSGSPPNTGATMMGEDQGDDDVDAAVEIAPDCGAKKAKKTRKWDDCMCAQVCEMVKAYNDSKAAKGRKEVSPSSEKSPLKAKYDKSINDFTDKFATVLANSGPPPKPPNPDAQSVKDMFYSPPPPNKDCQHEKWKKQGAKAKPRRKGNGAMNPDHMHPASLSGPLTSANCIWADARVNRTVGGGMNKCKPAPKKMKAHPSCNCP